MVNPVKNFGTKLLIYFMKIFQKYNWILLNLAIEMWKMEFQTAQLPLDGRILFCTGYQARYYRNDDDRELIAYKFKIIQ